MCFQFNVAQTPKHIIDSEVLVDSEGWYSTDDEALTTTDAMLCMLTGECRVPRRLEHQEAKLLQAEQRQLQTTMQVFDSEDTFEIA